MRDVAINLSNPELLAFIPFSQKIEHLEVIHGVITFWTITSKPRTEKSIWFHRENRGTPLLLHSLIGSKPVLLILPIPRMIEELMIWSFFIKIADFV